MLITFSEDVIESSDYQACVEAVHALSAGKDVPSEDILDLIGQLPEGDKPFFTILNQILGRLEGDPILPLLDLSPTERVKLADAFSTIKHGTSSKVL